MVWLFRFLEVEQIKFVDFSRTGLFLIMVCLGQTDTLEKVAPWSVISGSFAVCISPLGEYLALDLMQRKEVQSPLN